MFGSWSGRLVHVAETFNSPWGEALSAPPNIFLGFGEHRMLCSGTALWLNRLATKTSKTVFAIGHFSLIQQTTSYSKTFCVPCSQTFLTRLLFHPLAAPGQLPTPLNPPFVAPWGKVWCLLLSCVFYVFCVEPWFSSPFTLTEFLWHPCLRLSTGL